MSAKAVVLISGGLDSATVAFQARAEGFRIFALTFAYGQRHAREVECARAVARAVDAEEHRVVEIDLRGFGGSALTDDIDVPEADASASGIPVTYVPARNTIFLAWALAWAEVLGAERICIGVNAVDYSGYPDCRPEYIEAFQTMADLATKAGVEGRGPIVHAPLVGMTKAEIIRLGARLGADYGLTHSCYDPAPDGRACGRCDSCAIRRRGFSEAGVPDPTDYADEA